MNLTKEQAKQELQKLVDLFEKEMKSGEAMELNEANTKSTFIEPLLRLLGWDTNNHNEVCLEDAISRKRVDYSVRYNGRVEFFVEAKQVSVNLEDKRFINQAIGYGYSRKDVPFVVLTDFEGFKLFDVTVKPDIRNIRKGIKLDLNWKQYVDKFDDLWMLSKESVINGDLNKLLSTKPKDRVPVDKAVLNDLKVWREHLAKDIYKNNPDLFHSGDLERDADYLKEINQKLLDRIVFMRSCEDRGLVAGHSLRALFEDRSDSLGTRTMQVILDKEFAFYNRTFNSELFRPQDWEKDLKIEFKTLNAIIEDTYNPYQFDAIPLEVLGNIYEQFLGYTIRVTDKQVKYEEKPDVRKAGGVYYTPEYIVDYIVKNTVGKKLAELKEKDIKKLRILDPACGSGSFLIRAYEEMLNWYRDLKKKESAEKSDKQSQDKLFEQGKQQGDVLNIAEKAEILKRHIFGVDLDEQAVEVTKLSLVLKMLEGEFVPIGGQGVLPMLNQNIKCGNSLISGDPLLLTRYFGNDYYKIKPFNWEEQYKEVMEEGGFDCVIGNPPYGYMIPMNMQEYFSAMYSSQDYQKDLYLLFLERYQELIKEGMDLGIIVSNTWLQSINLKKIRIHLTNHYKWIKILFLSEKVFSAVVDTHVLVFKKIKNGIKEDDEVSIETLKDGIVIPFNKLQGVNIPKDGNCINIISSKEKMQVFEKIKLNSKPLSEFCDVYNGVKPFEKGKGKPPQTAEIVKTKPYVFEGEKPLKGVWTPLLRGSLINKYVNLWENNYWIKYGPWLAAPRDIEIFKMKEKIAVRQTGDSLIATMVDDKYILRNNLHIIIAKDKLLNLNVVLAIMNSKLMDFCYTFINPEKGEALAEVKKNHVEVLPIVKIIQEKSSDVKRLSELVEVVMNLKKKQISLAGTNYANCENQITSTLSEIDDTVYRMYGINDKEKAIIEK